MRAARQTGCGLSMWSLSSPGTRGESVQAENPLRRTSRAQLLRRKRQASELSLRDGGEDGLEPGSILGPIVLASTSDFLAGEKLRDGSQDLLW